MKIENIKFKAKTFDNAGWVEGYYIKKPSYHQTPKGDVVEDGEDHLIFGMTKDDVQPLCYEVDPSTVCQFTGLKDCKGNEIWEHDLIHFVGYKPTAEVFWSEEDYAFMAASKNEPLYLLPHVLEIGKIERVGNKFDKEK